MLSLLGDRIVANPKTRSRRGMRAPCSSPRYVPLARRQERASQSCAGPELEVQPGQRRERASSCMARTSGCRWPPPFPNQAPSDSHALANKEQQAPGRDFEVLNQRLPLLHRSFLSALNVDRSTDCQTHQKKHRQARPTPHAAPHRHPRPRPPGNPPAAGAGRGLVALHHGARRRAHGAPAQRRAPGRHRDGPGAPAQYHRSADAAHWRRGGELDWEGRSSRSPFGDPASRANHHALPRRRPWTRWAAWGGRWRTR